MFLLLVILCVVGHSIEAPIETACALTSSLLSTVALGNCVQGTDVLLKSESGLTWGQMKTQVQKQLFLGDLNLEAYIMYNVW